MERPARSFPDRPNPDPFRPARLPLRRFSNPPRTPPPDTDGYNERMIPFPSMSPGSLRNRSRPTRPFPDREKAVSGLDCQTVRGKPLQPPTVHCQHTSLFRSPVSCKCALLNLTEPHPHPRTRSHFFTTSVNYSNCDRERKRKKKKFRNVRAENAGGRGGKLTTDSTDDTDGIGIWPTDCADGRRSRVGPQRISMGFYLCNQ